MREKNNHKMEVLDRLVLSCVDITNQGMGVVKIDRFPFFVENLLPDEEAEIEITEIKSKFGFARVVEYLKISENRVAPICPFYDVCGGCQIMHIKDQNGFKYNQTHKTLKQFINPVINSPLDLGYRNKMTFQADKKRLVFINRGPMRLLILIIVIYNQI